MQSQLGEHTVNLECREAQLVTHSIAKVTPAYDTHRQLSHPRLSRAGRMRSRPRFGFEAEHLDSPWCKYSYSNELPSRRLTASHGRPADSSASRTRQSVPRAPWPAGYDGPCWSGGRAVSRSESNTSRSVSEVASARTRARSDSSAAERATLASWSAISS